MTIAGFTSTGSKRPEALYGAITAGVPVRMLSSAGCTVRASDGNDYLDFIMALGAVSLGYGHPEVNAAAIEAMNRGVIGPLSPVDEEALAAELGEAMPWLEEIRFLKTGAEAVAAAVRLARVATSRDLVLGCGYHGWLDWSSGANGVPVAVKAQYAVLPFNDIDRATATIRAMDNRLAAVVIEPVIDAPPDPVWLAMLRAETERVGAVLIFDEIKTAFRIAVGGATERWGVRPDLMVIGKAMANGFPLAAIGGRASLMRRVNETWISSTTATEFVSLAAARATLAVVRRDNVPGHLASIGARLWAGLRGLGAVKGIPEMCYLDLADDAAGEPIAVECARRGLLWKRTAYNFVSLAHNEAVVDRALEIIGGVLEDLRARPVGDGPRQ